MINHVLNSAAITNVDSLRYSVVLGIRTTAVRTIRTEPDLQAQMPKLLSNETIARMISFVGAAPMFALSSFDF
jgi:hypothetical protein